MYVFLWCYNERGVSSWFNLNLTLQKNWNFLYEIQVIFTKMEENVRFSIFTFIYRVHYDLLGIHTQHDPFQKLGNNFVSTLLSSLVYNEWMNASHQWMNLMSRWIWFCGFILIFCRSFFSFRVVCVRPKMSYYKKKLF